MKKKNLTPPIAKSVNCLSTQDLPVELVELSDEALSQVYGGTTWGQLLLGLGGFRPTWKPSTSPKNNEEMGPDILEGPICGLPGDNLPTLYAPESADFFIPFP